MLDLLRRSREEIARAAGVSPRADARHRAPHRRELRPRHWTVVVRGPAPRAAPTSTCRRLLPCGATVSLNASCATRWRTCSSIGRSRGRPLWVREGMAGYFAGRSDATDRAFPVSLRCPSNDELRRPSSREAQTATSTRARRRALRARLLRACGGATCGEESIETVPQAPLNQSAA